MFRDYVTKTTFSFNGTRDTNSETVFKEKHSVMDPMPELTITSSYVDSRVHSKTCITGNPLPESTITLCQSRRHKSVFFCYCTHPIYCLRRVTNLEHFSLWPSQSQPGPQRKEDGERIYGVGMPPHVSGMVWLNFSPFQQGLKSLSVPTLGPLFNLHNSSLSHLQTVQETKPPPFQPRTNQPVSWFCPTAKKQKKSANKLKLSRQNLEQLNQLCGSAKFAFFLKVNRDLDSYLNLPDCCLIV